MYIPVADATFGGTPIDSNNGLKMEPPPRPRAPDTHPPTKEKTMSLTNYEPSSLTSLLPRPAPYFILSICSLLTILTAIKQSAIQIKRYTTKLVQSYQEHVSTPKIDLLFLLPLTRLTTTKIKKINKLNPYFFH